MVNASEPSMTLRHKRQSEIRLTHSNGVRVVSERLLANVVFKMSYALQRKRKDQVILVKRKRDDIQMDEVPFDFSKNRHIQYQSQGQAKKQIGELLKKD